MNRKNFLLSLLGLPIALKCMQKEKEPELPKNVIPSDSITVSMDGKEYNILLTEIKSKLSYKPVKK